jgi:anti-sigma B factor antagonist
MKIEHRMAGDVWVLAVEGDITMEGSAAIRLSDKVRSALMEGRDRILLDLGRVRYVDSSGLGELIETYAAVRNRGGQLKLVNVGKRVNDLLVMTKLLTVFDCYDEEREALASFGSAKA